MKFRNLLPIWTKLKRLKHLTFFSVIGSLKSHPILIVLNFFNRKKKKKEAIISLFTISNLRVDISYIE